MVGICQCHIPTPIHYDIFPPGGNMTGGNLLGNQDVDDVDNVFFTDLRIGCPRPPPPAQRARCP